jgi:hypothetical protein
VADGIKALSVLHISNLALISSNKKGTSLGPFLNPDLDPVPS